MLYVEDVIQWALRYKGPKYHALLCDPPYHLHRGFMNKEWDKGQIAFEPECWEALAEHLLPGAFGLVYTGSYNWHKIAMAIEQAGLIIHPSIFAWIYGTGMGRGTKINHKNFTTHRYGKLTLKASVEPIVCFRKEYKQSPQNDIVLYGSGAMDVVNTKLVDEQGVERYPPNVVICEDTAKILNDAIGKNVSDYFMTVNKRLNQSNTVYYSAKASRKERDLGLEGLENTKVGVLEGRQDGSFGKIPIGKNNHPTIKPLVVSQWLAELLLPPSSVPERRLLNPFSGTGSEAIGGYRAGWESVTMIEIDPQYAKIAKLRLSAHVGVHLGDTYEY